MSDEKLIATLRQADTMIEALLDDESAEISSSTGAYLKEIQAKIGAALPALPIRQLEAVHLGMGVWGVIDKANPEMPIATEMSEEDAELFASSERMRKAIRDVFKWWTTTPGFAEGADDMPAEIFDQLRDSQ